jgi:hypothetical protein
MRPKLLALILVSIFLGLSAWSPWITANTASELAQDQFNEAWYGVADGCGSYGNNPVTHNFQKVPFGGTITLDYQCGLVMPDEPPQQTTVYVSFLGIAFGYPKP